MQVTQTALSEVLLFEPDVHGDERGFLLEYFQRQRFQAKGMDLEAVQINHSRSGKGVLRGLHYQLQQPQGKLVQVVRGEVFDVAVDIRQGSPTFAHWTGAILSEQNHHQLYIPPGFAHGFCVLSEVVDVLYMCNDYYRPDDEYGIAWDDPGLNIQWPDGPFTLSDKDQHWPTLADVSKQLPLYGD